MTSTTDLLRLRAENAELLEAVVVCRDALADQSIALMVRSMLSAALKESK